MFDEKFLRKKLGKKKWNEILKRKLIIKKNFDENQFVVNEAWC